MNTNKLNQILNQYYDDFERNWFEEKYKWQEVKTFQENWNLNDPDFLSVLKKSIDGSSNLVASRNYFPFNEIQHIVEVDPYLMRNLFFQLFDEKIDLEVRIEEYRSNLKLIKKQLGMERNDGADLRFISTMLWFKYPEKYSIYKFTEMRDFSENLEVGLKFKIGNIQSISLTQVLIDQIENYILETNPRVLEKYYEKLYLSKNLYKDQNLHLFCQNLIWYAQRTYKNLKENKLLEYQFVKGNLIKSFYRPIVLKKGIKSDYSRKEEQNRKTGISGESYILSIENQKLKNLGLPLKAEWVSQNQGDGLGYDIVSYNENKEKIYIEVKTTKGLEGDRFFITATELEACKQYGDNYYLYRLFDFMKTNKIAIYRGAEVERLCNSPFQYAVEQNKI
jgi:hypothetical protein